MQTARRWLWQKTDATHIQLFRYIFVAAVGLVADFGGLIFLKQGVGLNYLLAAAISFTVALALNYALSVWWVFPASRYSRRQEFALFAVIGLVGLGLNSLLMWVLTSGLGVFYIWSKACTTIVVFGWNFLARKAMFKPARRPALSESPLPPA
jgi:putative flippase GtrA